jgi:ATP adenylyltransferase
MLNTYDRADLDLSTTDRGCRFCEVAHRERLVRSSEHSAVFPSLGAFIEGWLLVAPREHVVASSELPDDHWHDLDAQVRTANEAVRAEYGPTVFFEHGAAGTNRTAGCGVDHAHLHIVPWVGNLREQIAAVPGFGRFAWHPAGHRPISRTGEDYIWISDETGAWITYASELPSQVVRQAMSHALGLAWWDWKVDHRTDTAAATLDRLSTVA